MLANYIVKNGTLLSVLTGEKSRMDIRVKDGIITEIAPDIQPCPCSEVIDATGLTITIGWVDAHCHFGVVPKGIGLDPDECLLTQGVTYAVDQGTGGPENFDKYRKAVRYRTELGYKSYLNMGLDGINMDEKDTVGPEDVDIEKIKETYLKYKDELLGLKIRIDTKFCFDSMYMLETTRKLADELGCPMVVHAPRCDKPLEYVLSFLKKGDIIAHVCSGKTPNMGIVDENGKLRPCVEEARSRGVIFDLSHGTNAFCYKIAEAAWKEGFIPDTISTDLWRANYNGPVFNMSTVLSKMRGMTGLDWLELIKRVTVAPVELMGLPGKELEIKVGAKADLVAFEVENGKYLYNDSEGDERIVDEHLKVHFTCLGNKVYYNTRTDDVKEVG